MDITTDLPGGLLTIGRFTFLVIVAVLIINTIVLIINRESKRDYTDQTGTVNFKRYMLATGIMVIILIVIGYALFVDAKI